MRAGTKCTGATSSRIKSRSSAKKASITLHEWLNFQLEISCVCVISTFAGKQKVRYTILNYRFFIQLLAITPLPLCSFSTTITYYNTSCFITSCFITSWTVSQTVPFDMLSGFQPLGENWELLCSICQTIFIDAVFWKTNNCYMRLIHFWLNC